MGLSPTDIELARRAFSLVGSKPRIVVLVRPDLRLAFLCEVSAGGAGGAAAAALVVVAFVMVVVAVVVAVVAVEVVGAVAVAVVYLLWRQQLHMGCHRQARDNNRRSMQKHAEAATNHCENLGLRQPVPMFEPGRVRTKTDSEAFVPATGENETHTSSKYFKQDSPPL